MFIMIVLKIFLTPCLRYCCYQDVQLWVLSGAQEGCAPDQDSGHHSPGLPHPQPPQAGAGGVRNIKVRCSAK